MLQCPKCEGKKTIQCPTCGGDGHRYFVPVLDFWEADCTQCYGEGTVKCPECEGHGEVFHAVHSPILRAPMDSNGMCDSHGYPGTLK